MLDPPLQYSAAHDRFSDVFPPVVGDVAATVHAEVVAAISVPSVR